MDLEILLTMRGVDLAQYFGARRIQYAIPLCTGPVYSSIVPSVHTLQLRDRLCNEQRWCLFEPEHFVVKRLLLAVENNHVIEPGQLRSEHIRYAFPGCLGDIDRIVAEYNKQ